MKVTILSRYSRLGASSRVRMMQYLTYLEKAGFQVEIAPLFENDYLVGRYTNQGSRNAEIRTYVRRLSKLHTARNADLIWVEKEALPWQPWALESAFLPRNVPIVTDYDDAIFHNYDLHRLPPVRWLLGRKIDRVMAASELVTVGNAYLASRAKNTRARSVEIVPTVVDLSRYTVRSQTNSEMAPCIGWIGTPSTWVEYVSPMIPMLTAVAAVTGSRIIAVGPSSAKAHPLLSIMPWSEETEVSRIQEMDIGIMPLIDTPWARGKCGYKLIQYMACGLPVVASPVGVNKEIIQHGVNGFLAESEEEWRTAIETLISNPDLRRKMGSAGRQKVETDYSLQVWGPRVANMLRRVANNGNST